MERFSICRDRLAAFQAAADAARGEKSAGLQRLNNLRGDIAAVEAELRDLAGSYRDQPERRGRAERRLETLRDELRQAEASHARGAAHRDHAVQMAARLNDYVAKQGAH